MPRKKLSEYRSKKIIADALGNEYVGWEIKSDAISEYLEGVTGYAGYVVKVDQAVKGRFKKGLVLLNIGKNGLFDAVAQLKDKGYDSFLVEPYKEHQDGQERYLSIGYDRKGHIISYSEQGGVDIESNPESVQTFRIDAGFDWKKIAEQSRISEQKLQTLFQAFKDNLFVFLEINPYFVENDELVILDSAVEIDDAGMHFVKTWNREDIRSSNAKLTKQEQVVQELNEGSAASFSLTVINPNGSIFLLLSGGGASIVVADEVYNKGFGKELANYGEYSGNPDLHEAYKYTTQVLELILASNAPKKVLFIGGAVANFTDIATTFAGVIKAIDEYASQLETQKLTVYVRRGGPNQEKGLLNIKDCLEKHGLLGGVYDPSTTINEALGNALKELES